MDLREARQAAGLTLRKAGDLIGVSFVTVQQWEMATTSPMVNRLPAIAKAYGLTLNEAFQCYQETYEKAQAGRHLT